MDVVVVVLKVIKVWAPDNGKGLGKGHRPNFSVAIPPPQRLDEQATVMWPVFGHYTVWWPIFVELSSTWLDHQKNIVLFQLFDWSVDAARPYVLDPM